MTTFFLRKKTVGTAIFLIILLTVLVRLPAWMCYQPVLFVDSPGYLDYAASLGLGDFSQHDGFRVPGYSIFLLMCGRQPGWIWMAQTVLGILSAGLCYAVARLLGCSWGMGLVSGILYATGLQFIVLEAAILSETLSLFFLLAICWVALIYVHDPSNRGVSWLVGLLAGGLALVRPQFVFLGGWLGLMLGIFSWRIFRSFPRMAGVLVRIWGPWAALLVFWSTVNAVLVGSFTLSTTTGYSLLNHSGRFIEFAAAEDAEIRDFYLHYRNERMTAVEATGGNVSFLAVPLEEFRRAKGMTYAEFSTYLSKMSSRLFIRHPLLYLHSVAEAWLRFWRIPLIWQAENWQGKGLNVVKVFWMPEKLVWLTMCVLFIILTPRLLPWFFSAQPERFSIVLLLSVIWATSVLQALTNFGENARYAIPVLPLVPLVLMAYASQRHAV